MTSRRYSRSSFVTIVALVSIAAALYSLVQSYSTLSLQNNPEFQLVKQFMPSAFVSPATMYAEMILDIAAIAASIGLFLRIHRARVLYMFMLVLFTGWEIYSSVSAYMTIGALLQGAGAVDSLSLIIMEAALAVGFNGFLIWKLSSVNVREEFTASGKSATKARSF